VKGLPAMSNTQSRLYELLKRPLVTEKATALTMQGQYTFEVEISANKIELKQAFEKAFPGRKVVKIQTTKMYAQQKRVGRHHGHTSESKKAIFTVSGDPIELFTGV
jgi:large subunit ribosomal protein L23